MLHVDMWNKNKKKKIQKRNNIKKAIYLTITLVILLEKW